MMRPKDLVIGRKYEVSVGGLGTSRTGQLEFVTFDPGRKHLVRVVAVNGKKVVIRRFNNKTGEWQTKNESRERDGCIPLTDAEAEESFPGCVAAWEAAKLPSASAIKEDNPNAAALVGAFKENDRDMEAWRKGAAPMVEALENDLKASGEIWYGGKRYTSIKKWCGPALGIKYRAMRYRLTGGNPVSKRKKKGATVAPKVVTLKEGMLVRWTAFGSENVYRVTDISVLVDTDDESSLKMNVEPYIEEQQDAPKPRETAEQTKRKKANGISVPEQDCPTDEHITETTPNGYFAKFNRKPKGATQESQPWEIYLTIHGKSKFCARERSKQDAEARCWKLDRMAEEEKQNTPATTNNEAAGAAAM